MKTIHINDAVKIGKRVYTDNGYLVVPGRLARTGVQVYLARELGLDGGNKMIRLHRPHEEVFSQDSLSSFEGVPITVGHPREGVTADNWREHAVGDARGVKQDDKFMAATLIIRDKRAIELVDEEGVNELSNGYTFDLDMTPGVTNDGEPYDGVQRNIRGNHVAIVSTARCGSACKIADGTDDNGSKTMATRKVVVDGIALEVEDTAASVIEKLTRDRDTAIAAQKVAETKAADSVSNDELKKQLKVKDDEIEVLKRDAMTPEVRDAMVADWATLLNDAKALAPDYDAAKKTCLQIRRDLITKLAADERFKSVADAALGGRKVEALDGDAARNILNTLKAVAGVTAPSNDATTAGDALLGNKQAGDAAPKPQGRDAFLANLQSGFNVK